MRRTNKQVAPLRAWLPLGVSSALSLVVGEFMWNYGAFFPIGVILAFACVILGMDLLHKYGARPLHVAAVVIGLAVGQFRMIQILLLT
ncbi:MAG TPA: hypothetical protein VF800_22635 [Telluria sp.]|jgi:hypothetical protein